MDLIRDVLDKQIVDRASDKLGKVDGLVVTIGNRERPRVSAIEVGPVTLATRLGKLLASVVSRVLSASGAGPGTTRFDVRLIKHVEIEVMLDVVAEETAARKVEQWLRHHIVGRIPGSGVKG